MILFTKLLLSHLVFNYLYGKLAMSSDSQVINRVVRSKPRISHHLATTCRKALLLRRC